MSAPLDAKVVFPNRDVSTLQLFKRVFACENIMLWRLSKKSRVEKSRVLYVGIWGWPSHFSDLNPF